MALGTSKRKKRGALESGSSVKEEEGGRLNIEAKAEIFFFAHLLPTKNPKTAVASLATKEHPKPLP